MNTKQFISRLLVVFLIGVFAFSQVPPAQAASVSTDGFNPGADDEVYTLAVQSDGKILVGGSFRHLGAGGTTACDYVGRLNPDGSLDTCFTAAPNGTVRALAVQPDGKILVGGDFTMLGGDSRNHIGRFNSDGSLDDTFNPGATGGTGSVYSLVVQLVPPAADWLADGRILVGGDFTNLGGVNHNYVGRLTAGGASDGTFSAQTDRAVNAIAVQLDGKVLLGGIFTNLIGISSQSYLGRINPTDSIDTSFRPLVGGPVEALAVQADGKILLGGTFTSLDGDPQKFIGRLNLDGSLDGTFAAGNLPNSAVHTLVVQPDGKVLVGGSFTMLGASTRNYIGRYNQDGTLDANFNPGASANAGGLVHALAVQPDGKLLVGGLFTQLGGSVRNSIGRLYLDGSLDTDLNPGANNIVYALAVQPDDKILVGGSFTTLGGVSRNYLGRLNPDGTLDASFTPELNGAVYALVVQPNGKILVGGDFTTMGIYNRGRIGRLNMDGSVDTGFDPGAGADGSVAALAVQPSDGAVLVGGSFTTLHGTSRAHIGRLASNGDLDAGFDPGATGGTGIVASLAVQPADGAILVGGSFTALHGTSRAHIGRLASNGNLDTGFNPGATGATGIVQSLALQPDGKILVAGDFTTLAGSARNRIGRLASNGDLDTGFNPGTGANDKILTQALQPDGKILVAGNFTTLHGTSLAHIGRLASNGDLDTGFTPDANAIVYALALQPDGKILVGGDFSTLGGGNLRARIGRLSSATAALQNLAYDKNSGALTWTRSGAGPEITRVTFEDSADGISYSSLGAGARISGGWQRTGVSLPVGQHFVRARGYYSTGDHNGSGSVVESVRNIYIDDTLPAVNSILLASVNPTNAPSVDFTIIFSVPVTGVDVSDFAATRDFSGGLGTIESVTGSGDTYTITVDTNGHTGSLGLEVLNDYSIIDAYTHSLTAGFTTDLAHSYTIDLTSLTVMSVTRRDSDPHGGPSVRFDVTFSEPVTGVVMGDFTVTYDGTLTGVGVTGVSCPGGQCTVTVGFGTGDGNLGLQVNMTGAIVGDAAPHHPLTAGYTTGESYTIDQSKPTATKSETTSDTPTTNYAPVNFLVTFSEAVKDVVPGDFTISTTGDLANWVITEVTGIGTTRTVTVNSGTGTGNLTLVVAGGNAIQDLASNPLDGGIISSAYYAIDRHRPTVSSIELASPNPTIGLPYEDFKVTFSEDVIGVDTGDFFLTPTGTVAGTINSFSGSGSIYYVRVNSITGTGTLRLDVKSSGTGILHDSYDLLGGFTSGQAYTIDQTPPTVSASLRADLTNPTTATTVHFTVIFSEPVNGVDTSDFQLTNTGGITGTIASVTPLDSTTYTVTINSISGLYGTLRLDVKSSGVTITDLYGNSFTGGFTGGQSYTIDRVKTRLYMPLVKR